MQDTTESFLTYISAFPSEWAVIFAPFTEITEGLSDVIVKRLKSETET